jgi:predicted amidohydrolase YtcJ
MRLLLTLLLATTVFLVSCNEEPPTTGITTSAADVADLVIRDARIWTGNPSLPEASAIAIRGERIIAVGDTGEIEGLIGAETEVLRSPLGLVVPGFIDSHVHLLPSGFELSSVKLRNAATPEDFARRIGDFAARLSPGQWITGGTWDHQNWGGELPRRDWIDALTPDNPVRE